MNPSRDLCNRARSRRSPACTTFGAKRDAADEVHLMDHSTLTHLMVPGTGVVDFFRREITSDQMAESVACFVGTGKAAT
jgi:protein SCO1